MMSRANKGPSICFIKTRGPLHDLPPAQCMLGEVSPLSNPKQDKQVYKMIGEIMGPVKIIKRSIVL